MDFIKTSSLRALIELTFQRNWNGLIWMSRKGVTTKRVETVQTALSRNSAQPRSPAGRGTHVPRSAKTVSVRLKSRPKSKPLGRSRITTRETKPAVGHATTATPRRASREVTPRGRATRLAYRAERSVRPGNYVPRPAERFHRPNLSARPRRPTVNVRPRPFRLGHNPTVRPIVPTDRPNAAVDPKPVLKPDFIFSSPA
ncbi:unnamed protein product [Microthlaspi erraticum]|uniref:Uncharacterized protein n=1 Tax=Microthlaspi erraticum TaxID=1685480 RepID=A0A6D2HXS1_9BRAS|nr:unnamed protein product [Microthlaspi erraticum]